MDMVWILLIVAVVIAGAVVYLKSLPAGYKVVRSIVIAKPLPEVFDYIVDFKHWNAWSPWMLHEPNAKSTTTNGAVVGGVHTWDGAKIGAGQMQHHVIVPNERIEMLLSFFRPFKSEADVTWEVKDASKDGQGNEQATEVIWTMEAHMPLPFRPFQFMFARMIGYDFDLGLALLRGQLDPASEHPTIAFEGVQERPAQLYATEHFKGTFDDMRGVMQEAYPRLWNSIAQDTERWEHKPAIAAYHKVNLGKQTTVMDIGFAVKSAKTSEASLSLPAGRYFVMRLTGSYQFLPSAWNTIYGQIKMQKLKIDKRQPALEVYQTNAMEAANSNDYVTFLCVPLK
jgi:predicted transcriptional regulator YdeE/uncharacterized protein YndB with AHSA1/START domain